MIRVTAFGHFSNELKKQYIDRIRRAIPFEWTDLPLKHPSKKDSKITPEEKAFLSKHKSFCILNLKGRSMTSEEFCKWCFAGPDRHLVIGPAAGFSDQLVERAEEEISLSKMTFTHGLAQIMLAESLYRAVCQMQNHPFVK